MPFSRELGPNRLAPTARPLAHCIQKGRFQQNEVHLAQYPHGLLQTCAQRRSRCAKNFLNLQWYTGFLVRATRDCVETKFGCAEVFRRSRQGEAVRRHCVWLSQLNSSALSRRNRWLRNKVPSAEFDHQHSVQLLDILWRKLRHFGKQLRSICQQNVEKAWPSGCCVHGFPSVHEPQLQRWNKIWRMSEESYEDCW